MSTRGLLLDETTNSHGLKYEKYEPLSTENR